MSGGIVDEDSGFVEQQHVMPVAKPDDHYFGYSRPAMHKYGICYRGPFETRYDGVNMAVRAHVGALAAVIGRRVWLRSLTHTHSNSGPLEPVLYDRLPNAIHEEVGHLTESHYESTLAQIFHVVPTVSVIENLVYGQHLGTDAAVKLAVARMSVLYCALEWTVVPASLVSTLSKFGQIWVPSEFAKGVLVRSGLDSEHVRVVPHPIMPSDVALDASNRVPHGTFRFLHISKWEPRKAQYEAMHAFALAFSDQMPDCPEFCIFSKPFYVSRDYPSCPDEAFELIWKDEKVRANWQSVQSLRTRLRVYWNVRSQAQTAKGIKTFEGVPASTHHRMYQESDVYVSSARMEGFDLSTSQAALAGCRILVAGMGAQSEFVGPGDIEIGSSALVEAPAAYNYPTGSKWSAFTVQELSLAMRSAFEAPRDQDEAQARIRSDRMKQRRDPLKLGAQMVGHLSDLAKRNGMAEAWAEMFK